MTPTTEWAAKLAAAEETGVLSHAMMTFMVSDRATPAGRTGRVWADSAGYGYWIADRKGMTLLEMRSR